MSDNICVYRILTDAPHPVKTKNPQLYFLKNKAARLPTPCKDTEPGTVAFADRGGNRAGD